MYIIITIRGKRKAVNKARRIVDAYLPRVAGNTWMGNITELGHLEIKRQLGAVTRRGARIDAHNGRGGEIPLWTVGERPDETEEGHPIAKSIKITGEQI